MFRRLLPIAALLLVGCSATEEEGPEATTGAKLLPPCTSRAARDADGNCHAVGPAEPDPAKVSFTRAPDGWGLGASHGTTCAADQIAVLGTSACAPVDDCAAAFPPKEAEVVVSTTMTGDNVVATISEAMGKITSGGTIAIDSGHYGPVSLKGDVTLVGRCAKDTFIGETKSNAVFVNGGKVRLRSVTVTSTASPLAVQSGVLEAEKVIVSGANVGLGVAGSNASLVFTRSLLVGLGTKTESLGAMVAKGGKLVIESSELRDVSSGILSTDEGSVATLRTSLLHIVPGPATQSGLESSAKGLVEVEGSLVTSSAQRLVAVYSDKGTGGVTSGGRMAIRWSILEQGGAELKDAPAIALEGGELALADTTLRHQAPIGINIGSGKLHLERAAILGNEAPAKLRTAVMAIGSRSMIEATGLVIPHAQGIGIGIDNGARLTVVRSLVSNVAYRHQAQSAFLVSRATATFSESEMRNVDGSGIIGIGGATVGLDRVWIHGNHRDPNVGPESPRGFGLLALHTDATVDRCLFEENDEGLAAAGGRVAVSGSTFASHKVALRAMDAMTVVEDSSELQDQTLAIAECTFRANAERVSTETLPDLDAPPSR